MVVWYKSRWFFQHKDIKAIGEHLNLGVDFDEEKRKSILFSPKHRSKSTGQVDIS